MGVFSPEISKLIIQMFFKNFPLFSWFLYGKFIMWYMKWEHSSWWLFCNSFGFPVLRDALSVHLRVCSGRHKGKSWCSTWRKGTASACCVCRCPGIPRFLMPALPAWVPWGSSKCAIETCVCSPVRSRGGGRAHCSGAPRPQQLPGVKALSLTSLSSLTPTHWLWLFFSVTLSCELSKLWEPRAAHLPPPRPVTHSLLSTPIAA